MNHQVNPEILTSYARLLVNYCLELREKEKLYIRTTTLAEPLVKEVYREALKAGAIVEVQFDFDKQDDIFFSEARQHQLEYVPLLQSQAIHSFNAYLNIRAPFETEINNELYQDKIKIRQNALADINKRYFERIGTKNRDLKRNLCQYPTASSAHLAGLSLEEYQHFVFDACRLYDTDPIKSWLEVRETQQHIVDYLNNCTRLRYVTEDTDISFSCDDRTWINSDGQNNMPSGEVFTSPVEDSVNGHIYFSYPSVYMSQTVTGVRLWVKDGWIERWDAETGRDFLDKIFEMDGARRFGEAAIGTNYRISKITKNILFDEKIGGSVHMAIGQSYLQCGGKNESAVHWDMITDMKKNGQIFADGHLIYEKGKFLI